MSSFSGYVSAGIPDEQFERGRVPLTKEEIRCLSLSKLKLKKGQTVLDVGAGSGGLSIEAALLMPGGQVFAVEKDKEALALIRANLDKFGVENVTVIEGPASLALQKENLPQSFDRVIIGGSGGELADIIKRIFALLVPGGLVVINCILLETLQESLCLLEDAGFKEINFIQASIARSQQVGAGNALKPLNPVFVVSAEKA